MVSLEFEGVRKDVRLSPPPKNVANVDLLCILAAFVRDEDLERVEGLGVGGDGIESEPTVRHLCDGKVVSKPW